MRAIRLGLQIQPQHASYDALRRAAVTAEEMGFDIVYNWDHFYPLYGDRDWSKANERKRNFDLMPNAHRVELVKTGHFASLERPKEIAAAILRHANP